jgi:hypothetical protein
LEVSLGIRSPGAKNFRAHPGENCINVGFLLTQRDTDERQNAISGAFCHASFANGRTASAFASELSQSQDSSEGNMSSDEIAGIERFADFYNRLGSATHNEYSTKRHAKVESEESFNAQRQHLLGLYKDVEVQHSFVDGTGQIFDCIPINQQPALKKSGRPLATPPTLPVRHAPASPRAPTLAPLHPDRRDRYGNAMGCPEGTVAIRRVTLDEMTRFEDLEHFLRKTPRHKQKRAHPLFAPPDVSDAEDPPHEYAHAYQTINNIGGHSALSIWDPAITGDQIFSLSQHWYVATTDTGLVQTAEVGWQVFPQKYGHSRPVLFTYWTADGYASTGSYSNDNGDFVQYSSTCPVGLALEQVSAIGGAQAEIELSFVLSDGNWWLYVNGADTADAVGYYATALYQNGPLATGATEIDYGGETVGVSSYPPMGSGQFAAQGKGQAAYHRNIYLFPPGGGTQDADLQASQDWPQSYTIAVQSSNEWGEYFFFGGPGSAGPTAPAPRAVPVGLLGAAAPPSPVSPAASPPAAPFDPADAVDYGLLIEAVYTMNANAAGGATPPVQSDFPSDYKLTAWVQMKDFVLTSTALKFYGVIAQSNTEPHRFVLALRGTEGAVEWLDNATSVWKTPFKIPGSGSVSVGFYTIYETMEIVEAPSAPAGAPAAAAVKSQSLRAEGGFSSQVAAHLRRRGPNAAAREAGAAPRPTETLDVVAHSLGGALATLYVMENASTDKIPNPILYTFASPMVGDATFVAAFNKLGLTSWRIVNSSDVVPMLPSALLGYQHVATAKTYSSTGLVQPNVGCWHAMATYLSLIDPTRLLDPACQLSVTATGLSAVRQIQPAVSTGPDIFGFDCDHYPGDPAVTWLRGHQFRVSGLYLAHEPGQQDSSWISKCAYLRSNGWGFFPTYVGLQIRSTEANATTGVRDGREAATMMGDAGFSPASAVYLDLEDGTEPSGAYLEYIQSWVSTIKSQGFAPALYCSYLLINWARSVTPIVWSFRIPLHTDGETYDPNNLPTGAVDTYCIATQYRQQINLSGLTIPAGVSDGIDLNLCLVADPSNLASISHVLQV